MKIIFFAILIDKAIIKIFITYKGYYISRNCKIALAFDKLSCKIIYEKNINWFNFFDTSNYIFC